VPVHPALVEAMVGVLGPDLERRTIDSGHMVMNSQPDTLAAVLAEVIRTRRGRGRAPNAANAANAASPAGSEQEPR
jgi:hypothetical protein